MSAFSMAAFSLVATAVGGAAPLDTAVTVVMETPHGDIWISVDLDRAPVTAANFLWYVDQGFYDGGRFYRTVRSDNQPNDQVRIAVIQGGIDRDRRDEAFDPIRLEGTGETGLKHLDGTVSVARAGPDTGRGEFFICVGDQPSLDEGGLRNPDGRGFAAFAHVVDGMDVVNHIHGMNVAGQTLTPEVHILGARRALRSR